MPPTELWGEFDHYFQGSKVKALYQVTVLSGSGGPAESLATSEARVFAATGWVSSSSLPDQTLQLKTVGKGELVLDLARWAPATDSPLLVQFYFEMKFASKAKDPETNQHQCIGVVLAEPEVHSIGMGLGAGRRQVVAVGDAKPGETVSFTVTEWGDQAFDRPGAPTYHGPVSSAEKKRFPAGYDAEVEWSVDGELHGTGSTFDLTVGDADLGKTVEVTAARTPFPLPTGRPATSKLVVPKLAIHGVKGETPASKVLIADPDGHGFKAHLTPAGYPGHFEWTLEGDRLELSDGTSSVEDQRIVGPTVRVLARRPSASAGDQTLVLTFISAATGKAYEARHRLTAATWPANICGRVIYERTWNYHDSTTPIAAVKEKLPGCTIELWGLLPGGTAPIRLSTSALGEDGAFRFEFVRECTKLSLRIFLEHDTKALVKVLGLSDAHLLAPALEVKTGAVVWGQVDLDVAKIAAGTHDLGEVTVTHSTFVELCDLYKSVWFGQRTFSKLRKGAAPGVAPSQAAALADAARALREGPAAGAAPGQAAALEAAQKDRWRTMGPTVVHVPQPEGVSHYSPDKDALFVLAGDYRDRCVILHEYGHRVDELAGPRIPNPGYDYDDDEAEGH